MKRSDRPSSLLRSARVRRGFLLALIVVVFVVGTLAPWFRGLPAAAGRPRFPTQLKTSAPRGRNAERFGEARVVEIQRSDSNRQNRGNALLEGYDPERAGRVCPRLPATAHVHLEDDFEVGVKAYVVRNASRPRGQRAFVLMVSNHKYVDGALVMADSLRSHSRLVQTGAADLLILVSDKIREPSLRQLATVFDYVAVLSSVARFSPKSYYTTTFDKMYLFWLTEYAAVAFFDADTLATGSPDDLFSRVPAKGPGWVAAVGDTDYFQTALLVLQPNRSVFIDIYLEYRFGAFGYNQWRARDGILLRTCLMARHDNMDHHAQLHHFYGYIKPWFDKDANHKHAKEPLSFDRNYLDWWTRYERLHKTYFVAPAWRLLPSGDDGTAEQADGADVLHLAVGPYGGAQGKKGESVAIRRLRSMWRLAPDAPLEPERYMWLQRYSVGSEYLRPTAMQYAVLRNYSAPSLSVHAGPPLALPTNVIGQEGATASGPNPASCTSVCGAVGKICVDAVLLWTAVNSCEGVSKAAGLAQCDVCRIDVDRHSKQSPLAPYAIVATRECVISFAHDPERMPSCDAASQGRKSVDGLRRVCGCVSQGEATSDAVLRPQRRDPPTADGGV